MKMESYTGHGHDARLVCRWRSSHSVCVCIGDEDGDGAAGNHCQPDTGSQSHQHAPALGEFGAGFTLTGTWTPRGHQSAAWRTEPCRSPVGARGDSRRRDGTVDDDDGAAAVSGRYVRAFTVTGRAAPRRPAQTGSEKQADAWRPAVKSDSASRAVRRPRAAVGSWPPPPPPPRGEWPGAALTAAERATCRRRRERKDRRGRRPEDSRTAAPSPLLVSVGGIVIHQVLPASMSPAPPPSASPSVATVRY